MKNADQPTHPVMDKLVTMGIDQGLELKSTGLTKREYFAGLAMQGLVTAVYSLNLEDYTRQLQAWDQMYGNKMTLKDAVANDAIAYADALLTQLEQR